MEVNSMHAELICSGDEVAAIPFGACFNGDEPGYGFYCFNLGITPTGGGKCKYGSSSINE